MEAAFYRAVRVSPPASLHEMRPSRGTVVLRCTYPGCTQCAEFVTSGARARYEDALSTVVPWDCGRPAYKALALAHGVDQLPAYVMVPATGPIRVETPPSHG